MNNVVCFFNPSDLVACPLGISLFYYNAKKKPKKNGDG